MRQFTVCLLAIAMLYACQTKSKSSIQDTHEQEALEAFYGQLKAGMKRKDVEKLLVGGRAIWCDGNSPGPQRCFVRFRVRAGSDFGAERLGITIQNATVKDDYKSVLLDFRDQKLLRWELRDEIEKRDSAGPDDKRTDAVLPHCTRPPCY